MALRTGAKRCAPFVGLIGMAALWTQRGLAREQAFGFLNAACQREREIMLGLSAKPATWAGLWRRASDLGPVAGPLLWRLREEAQKSRALPILVAASLASGGDAERLWDVVDSSGTDRNGLETRIAALLLLATLPGSREESFDPWPRIARDLREISPALEIVGYAAQANRTGPCAARDSDLRDPGILAAALLAGSGPARKAVFGEDPGRGGEHSDLVFRGLFLGWLSRPEQDAGARVKVLRAARSVLARADGFSLPLREAAALVLAEENEDPKVADPTGALLELSVSSAKRAARWQSRLEPFYGVGVERPEVLVAAFAMYAPLERIVAAVRIWSEHRDAARVAALALARRLLRTGERARELAMPMPGVPEWFWVQWACGEMPSEPLASEAADARAAELLRDAAKLARDGRLSREAAALLLEDALWRSGWHPGLGPRRVGLELLRDLVLTGSHPGTKYEPKLPPERRYFPRGLQRDAPALQVLVAFYDFLTSPGHPLPAGCRLR
ncbi:MAG: hypothetical protein Fur0037_25320 [Planctomycetota bacterium]